MALKKNSRRTGISSAVKSMTSAIQSTVKKGLANSGSSGGSSASRPSQDIGGRSNWTTGSTIGVNRPTVGANRPTTGRGTSGSTGSGGGSSGGGRIYSGFANSLGSLLSGATAGLLNGLASGVSGGSSAPAQSGSAGSYGGASSGWRPYDTSGNDYAGMFGMSDLHRAALEAAGRDYNNAATQEQRDAAHAQAEAIRALYGYSGGKDGSQYIAHPIPQFGQWDYAQPPQYEDPYAGQMDELLGQILNRDKFRYNAQDDPLYQQYLEQYLREGERSMQDTLGAVSARTGGLASSWAQTAAQEANDYYASQAADKIPELYQLAYDMYLKDLDGKVQDLGLLQNMSNRQYDRYRDTMSDWQNDRAFAYNKYRDQVGDSQWSQNFNYQAGRDKVNDQRYDTEWNYQVDRDKLDDARYDSETAYDRAMSMLSAGVMPSSDLLSKAGLTGIQAAAIIASANSAKASKSSGSSGGKKKSGTSSGSQDYSGLFRAARESGYPKSFIANNSKKYGFTSSSGLYDEYSDWLDNQGTGKDVTSLNYDEDSGIFTWDGKNYNSVSKLSDAMSKAGLTENEGEILKRKLNMFGFDA